MLLLRYMSRVMPEQNIFSGHAGRQLGLHAAGLILALTGMLAIAPLLPILMDTFAISAGISGILVSAMWISHAVAQYPAGRFADQFSSSTVLVGAEGVLIVGFTTLVLAETFVTFAIGVTLVGAGFGGFEASGLVHLGVLFDDNQGRAFGIRDAAVNVGSALSTLLVVVFIGYASWELAFIPVAIALGVVIVMTSLTTRIPYQTGRLRLNPLATLRSVTETRSVVVLIITATIMTIVWQGATTFLPTFLHRSKAYSTVQAAYLFATLFGVGIFATPAAGYLGDRFGCLKVGIVSNVTGVAGIVLLTQARGHLAVFGSIVLFAIGLTTFWPLLYTHLAEQFTQAQIGASLGILRTIFFTVGSLGPVVVGVVAEIYGYESSFLLLSILFAGSTFGLAWALIV